MIAGLQEIDAVIFNEINQSMFLGQPPRPDAGGQIFQRLGFAFSIDSLVILHSTGSSAAGGPGSADRR